MSNNLKIWVSKNCYLGDSIISINKLVELANEGKSVWCKAWNIKPASFIIGMPVRVICRFEFYEIINTKKI